MASTTPAPTKVTALYQVNRMAFASRYLRQLVQIVRWFNLPERVFALIASGFFPFAILVTLFAIQPSLGDSLVDALWERAQPGATDRQEFSVVSGIAKLFEDRDRAVGVVLLLFSIVFPIIKLTLLWLVLLRGAVNQVDLLRWLERLGPWSMADVFVVSVMLLSFKAFPKGTTFDIEVGFWLFLASVISAMIATHLASSRLDLSLGATDLKEGDLCPVAG